MVEDGLIPVMEALATEVMAALVMEDMGPIMVGVGMVPATAIAVLVMEPTLEPTLLEEWAATVTPGNQWVWAWEQDFWVELWWE